jgi:hypothetical protein|tara:strand:+ start:56 stop:229 length:174 start_codon:yes stop_codon:yes gene_type:complete
MSDKKTKEIIENLNRSIALGGNPQSIEKLKQILKSVEDGTYVSQFKKRAKRKPKVKK